MLAYEKALELQPSSQELQLLLSKARHAEEQLAQTQTHKFKQRVCACVWWLLLHVVALGRGGGRAAARQEAKTAWRGAEELGCSSQRQKQIII